MGFQKSVNKASEMTQWTKAIVPHGEREDWLLQLCSALPIPAIKHIDTYANQ